MKLILLATFVIAQLAFAKGFLTDPCFAVRCSHGRKCVVSNGRPRCVCRSYSYKGCGVLYQSSCGKKTCRFGARCVNYYGGPKCVCSFRCPFRYTTGRHLCASDEKTYRNLCELLRAQCKNQRRISIIKFGKCYEPCPKDKPRVNCFVRPCKFAKCPAFPKAKCLDDYCGGCFANFYWHGRKVNCAIQCPLRKCAVCPEGGDISNYVVDKNGCQTCTCKSSLISPCPQLRCPTGQFGNHLDKNGCKTCLLRKICPDGKPPNTCLISPCQFARCPAYPTAECETDYCDRSCIKTNFFVGSKKVDCSVNPGCAAVTCLVGHKCVIRNGKPTCKKACKSNRGCSQGASCQSGVCECNRFCPAVVGIPVCDSDGKKYGSMCHLNAAACTSNTSIKPVKCPVSSCATKLCPLGTICKNVNGKAECQRPVPTCAAVLCLVGQQCIIENGKANCKKIT